MRILSLLVALLLLPGMSAANAATSDGGAPMDYPAQAGQLTQPVYEGTVTEGVRLPMSDGVEIFVNITRPDPAKYPGLKVPVIMLPSPYNIIQGELVGRYEHPATDAQGNRIGLKGYFAPRGYAFASVDLRGTGHSGGCLGQGDRRDAADLKAVVEWLAARDWSTGRVGAIGHSFNGYAAAITAAQKPKGLATSVIIAGTGSAYGFQYQHGVPFYAHGYSPLWAYPGLTVTRFISTPVPFPIYGFVPSGVPASSQYANAACGFVSGATLAGPNVVTGQYTKWHADRDYEKELAQVDLPLFMVHGFDDDSARISGSEWFFGRRAGRSTDKVWIGPWDHGSGGERGEQWINALHAWFDRHLQQRPVSTGPAVEAFMDTGEVLTAPSWTPAQGATWFPDATDMSLKLAAPAQASTATFTARGNKDASDASSIARDWAELAGADGDLVAEDGGVEFTSAPLTHDLVLAGLPELRLRASITGANTSLVTTLWRQREDGTRRLMDVCAIQPQLRERVDTVTPVIPGEAMTLKPQCFTEAHHLSAGDQIVLRVGTGSLHHVPVASVDARVTVHTGPAATTYDMPVRPGARTYPDPFVKPAP